jgi:hypothetical protein
MGKDEYIQLKADEDDCVYMFNPEKGTAKKVCDIVAEKDVPQNVRDILLKLERRMNFKQE